MTETQGEGKGEEEKEEGESRSVSRVPLRPYTGVGSLSLIQGIFPSQGSNSDLPHCRKMLYQLSYQGSPMETLYFTLEGNKSELREGGEFLILNISSCIQRDLKKRFVFFEWKQMFPRRRDKHLWVCHLRVGVTGFGERDTVSFFLAH